MPTNAGEEGSEAVKVVLTPDLKRMVMALGALQAHAEEQATD